MSSAAWMERATKVIPGGVNSPVRAYGAVGGVAPFIRKGEGAYLFDEDHHRYIDYVGSWGPMILGHNHPDVREAVMRAAQEGLSFGAPTEREVLLAEFITKLMPNIEMIRFVSSGTEAAMSALRLARGFTGRNKIVKFEGCYHGHVDALLVSAGSGLLTFNAPSSPGIPSAVTAETLVLPYNNLEAVKEAFAQYGEDIACIIVEPVAGNMNCVPPVPGFLEGLRAVCDAHQSLLIFDEVMTGFRVHPHSAQGLYDIKPDLTLLAKIIGGGMPVGAFGGKKEIMMHLSPAGKVYQAGTLSGNPLGMAAGLATLTLTQTPHFYDSIFKATTMLMDGLTELAAAHGLPFFTHSVGAMFGFYFYEGPQITNLSEVKLADETLFKQFFHGLLEEGVYLAPSAFEAGFVSKAHDTEIIATTLEAAERVMKKMNGKAA